ncbi:MULTISPECIES: hypothetical protein [Bacillus cereus group]|uniref:hypothetical protein n=1 Tax=Bacillus cereus group TaxID=86661 RepID=UPI0037D46847
MEKLLPINESIPVTCFQFEAFPLAIISNYEDAYPWIHSNYIQLAFHKDFMIAPVPFKFYLFDYTIVPWLKVQKLDREIYSLINRDIVDFLKKAIDMGYYIYLNVDEYYIPCREAYKNFNKSHDILVFGYNEKELSFSVLGYNEKRFFSKTKVPYDLFEKAFLNLDNIENNCNQIYLFKFNEKTNYSFKINVVINSLEDYLFSRNSAEHFNALAEPEQLVFGIECYNYLDKYLDTIKVDNTIDLRYLQKVVEHKICMFNRINYLEQKRYLNKISNFPTLYDSVVQESKTIKLLAIKFNKVRNESTFIKIKQKIKNLKDLEVKILTNVLENLQQRK